MKSYLRLADSKIVAAKQIQYYAHLVFGRQAPLAAAAGFRACFSRHPGSLDRPESESFVLDMPNLSSSIQCPKQAMTWRSFADTQHCQQLQTGPGWPRKPNFALSMHPRSDRPQPPWREAHRLQGARKLGQAR